METPSGVQGPWPLAGLEGAEPLVPRSDVEWAVFYETSDEGEQAECQQRVGGQVLYGADVLAGPLHPAQALQAESGGIQLPGGLGRQHAPREVPGETGGLLAEQVGDKDPLQGLLLGRRAGGDSVAWLRVSAYLSLIGLGLSVSCRSPRSMGDRQHDFRCLPLPNIQFNENPAGQY